MTFMVMSAILAMFIDSITVILFLAAVTMELAQLLKFNPVPMILSENGAGGYTWSADFIRINIDDKKQIKIRVEINEAEKKE